MPSLQSQTHLEDVDQVVFEKFLQSFIQLQTDEVGPASCLVLPARALCTRATTVSWLARLVYDASTVIVDMSASQTLRNVFLQAKHLTDLANSS